MVFTCLNVYAAPPYTALDLSKTQTAVSYTHLDVYKRQTRDSAGLAGRRNGNRPVYRKTRKICSSNFTKKRDGRLYPTGICGDPEPDHLTQGGPFTGGTKRCV